MSEGNKIELRSEEFQEVLGSVSPWILRWGVTVLAVVVVILLIGSAIIKYPDVIPAQIVLTGSTPPAAIAARASGKLNELYVSDNQEVKSGDYLAVIDNPAQTEDVLKLKNYLNEWDFDNDSVLPLPEKDLRLGNLQSVYSTFYITLFDYKEYKRLSYYPQKREITQKRIVKYEEQYRNLLRQQQIIEEQNRLSEKQYRRDSTLNVKGVISAEELETSKSQYLQNLLSGENIRSSVNNMRIQIAQLKESLLDNNQQDVEKFNDLRSRIHSLVTQLKTEIQAWELNYVLKAPINGKITFTNYWTINQNVSAGEEVFSVIPWGLRVRSRVKARDAMTDEKSGFQIIGKASLPIARSGKVQIGQKVNIRLENFPDHEYGILRGTVQNISLVPTQSNQTINYTLEISLPEGLLTTYKKELPYLPNMQGQADIVTDDISLLERFILPVKKIWTESTKDDR